MPSIYMFTPTTTGGHPRYTQELLTALSEIEPDGPLDVSLVTSADLDPSFETNAYPIHKVLPVLKSRASFSSRPALIASRLAHYWNRERHFYNWLVARDRNAIVHFQEVTFWTGYFDIRRLTRAGVTVFHTVHNVRWHEHPWFLPPFVADRLRRPSLRACNGLMVHSEELKQSLSAILGRGHPPIFVTPHGAWSRSNRSRQTVDIPARLTRKHLLFFGIVGQYKGVHVLLEALRQLPEHYTLTIAGQPNTVEYHQRLRDMVQEFAPGRVEFIDRFVDEAEIPDLFEKSSLLVLPYVNFDAQSGVLHDAISWGLPVVGTDVGAIGTSIRNWNIGTVVEPGNAEHLATGIKALFEDEPYRAAMTGIEHSRQELGWERTALATREAYKSVYAPTHGWNQSTQS